MSARVSWRRGLLLFAGALGFVFALLQSVKATVAWWRGEVEPGWWEWLWIALLPLWLFIFFRYFSFLRCIGDTCAPGDEKQRRQQGP